MNFDHSILSIIVENQRRVCTWCISLQTADQLFLVFINKFSLIAIGSFTFSWGKPLKIATFLTYKELHGVFFFNLALEILLFLFVYCEQLIFNGVCLTEKKSINETKKSINYGIQINYRISQRPFSVHVYFTVGWFSTIVVNKN